MQTKDLKTLCLAGGVGQCREAAEAALRLLQPLTDEAYIDAKGNVIGIKRCGIANAPLLMLEAHIDQIGFVVTRTDEDGFLWVDACGRADERALAAQPVCVYTEEGVRQGVFCSTPPHLKQADAALPKTDAIGIDIGLQAGEQIPCGTFVGFAPRFEQNGQQVCATSLDDRSGVYALLCAMEKLAQQPLSQDIAVVFCAAEELGCRNAGSVAAALQPQVAVAVDVSFAYVPGSLEHQCGRMGAGAMIGHSPCLDRALSLRLERLAKQKGIAFQQEIMPETTGSDADTITVSGAGVRTALVSIPLKYMHTPIEQADLRDIEAVAELVAAFACEGGDAV